MDKPNLLDLVKRSFDHTLPETPEEITEELCAVGRDPDAIGDRMARAACSLLSNNRTVACAVCGIEVARSDAFVSPPQFGEALLCLACARPVR